MSANDLLVYTHPRTLVLRKENETQMHTHDEEKLSMGNCCSSRKRKEQLSRPYNTYYKNPLLALLEEDYEISRNLKTRNKGRYRDERYDLGRDLRPRRIEEWESRSKSRSRTRQRAVRSAGRSRAIRPSNPRSKVSKIRRKQRGFSEDGDDGSDSEDSEVETSDDDIEIDDESDSDSEDDHREMSRSVKSRRTQQSRKKKLGRRKKDIDEDEEEDEVSENEVDEYEENYEKEDRKNTKQVKHMKREGKQGVKGVSKKRVKRKAKSRLKAKNVAEDDKIFLLGKEEDENKDEDNEDNDAEDEEDQKESSDHPQNHESETGEKHKGKGIEKSNPYRWKNPSPISDKNKIKINRRVRAKGSDRDFNRQQDIQKHSKRRERKSSLKISKLSTSEGTSDDDWSDTDASSLATSKRSGSASSRLSLLFGPRNRSLTPEPSSHLMSPISPLTRPSISAKTGETHFGASVIRASPLQEIVSADSLPANPEPNDTIITPPPAVHQRPLLPLAKAGEPNMVGMKKVIFMSRGKRSSIKLVPSDGKSTDTDEVEIILT